MKNSNVGLIIAIVFASSVLSGSLVYVGMSMNSSASLAGKNTAPAVAQNNGAPSAAAPAAAPAAQKANVPKPDLAKDHVFGNKDARFSLIEYSDFICPFCKKFHPNAQAVVEQYKGQVNWVYRDFPLSIHEPQATDTAIAAKCVAKVSGNDAYWKFAQAAFDDIANKNRDAAYFQEMATKVGADGAKVADCFTKRETAADVQAQFDEGMSIGVNGTPASYIYDSKTGESFFVGGAAPVAKFSQIIDKQLAK